jgi:hypothetical protein
MRKLQELMAEKMGLGLEVEALRVAAARRKRASKNDLAGDQPSVKRQNLETKTEAEADVKQLSTISPAVHQTQGRDAAESGGTTLIKDE